MIEKEKTFLKTTLYFMVRLKNSNNLPKTGIEDSVTFIIEWHPIDKLISLMQEQSQGLQRQDLNESIILERAKSILAK